MGIVHHSNYLVWFEVGRTDLCREAGISYRDMEAGGLLLVVAEVGCRYRKSFLYDDEVEMLTSIGEWGSRGLRFDYELKAAGTGVVHATGFSAHLWVDSETRKPVRVPREIADRFAPFIAS